MIERKFVIDRETDGTFSIVEVTRVRLNNHATIEAARKGMQSHLRYLAQQGSMRVAEAVRRTPCSAPSANEQDISSAGGATTHIGAAS